MERIESLILQNLIFNDEYTRKVIPYLKEEYFADQAEKKIYEFINEFVQKYNVLPSVDAIRIISGKELKNPNTLEEIYKELHGFESNQAKTFEIQWLLDETESWCQERALYNAALETIGILDNKQSKTPKSAIPQIFQDALAVGFDPHVGHDYIEDAELRYEYYHKKENRIPFDIEWLNKITNDGVPPKTLNLILAGTNVGKTLCLCHLAAWYLSLGLNVFYGTMEVSEEEIAKRIDANLHDVDLDDIINIPRDQYLNKIQDIASKTHGKIVIREYATSQASVIHFKSTLNELFLKKGFKPDIIIIDYVGICSSSRLTVSSGMYQLGKAVAEELRGLAKEAEARLWSAVQYNRKGYGSSAPGLDDIGESFAIAQTADFTIGLMTNEDLEEMNQYLAIQQKNRYGDVTKYKRHMLGVNRPRQRIFDAGEEESPPDEEDEIQENDDRAAKFRGLKV